MCSNLALTSDNHEVQQTILLNTDNEAAGQSSTETVISKTPVIMTVPEMAKYLRIGRNNAYELVKEQGFPALKLGRQIRIPLMALNDWISSRFKEQ